MVSSRPFRPRRGSVDRLNPNKPQTRNLARLLVERLFPGTRKIHSCDRDELKVSRNRKSLAEIRSWPFLVSFPNTFERPPERHLAEDLVDMRHEAHCKTPSLWFRPRC